MDRSQAQAIREIQHLLGDELAGDDKRARRARRRTSSIDERNIKANQKPDHYSVICISLYKEDLAKLDDMVAELKDRGHRKMSRSGLIRFALDQVDLDALPKSY